VIAPNPNATYDITGVGPGGEHVDLPGINGEHVAVYSNP
jgi:hypothetical protein